MQLTIFAATGGVGRLLLQQAIDGGHEVVAVARNLTKLPPNLPKKLRMISADLSASDQVALKSAVEGSTAALSALGPRSKSEVGIAWRGTQAIVRAMKAAGAPSIA